YGKADSVIQSLSLSLLLTRLWHFTNPFETAHRWQRRWFVLYDDGELSYSVDEH
ncbi:hypothetical protein L9F63_018477, partial [Diploptera punctata]